MGHLNNLAILHSNLAILHNSPGILLNNQVAILPALLSRTERLHLEHILQELHLPLGLHQPLAHMVLLNRMVQLLNQDLLVHHNSRDTAHPNNQGMAHLNPVTLHKLEHPLNQVTVSQAMASLVTVHHLNNQGIPLNSPAMEHLSNPTEHRELHHPKQLTEHLKQPMVLHNSLDTVRLNNRTVRLNKPTSNNTVPRVVLVITRLL